MTTLLAEAFPLCFSALYCHSLRGFGCSRFILVVSVPRKRPLQTAVWDSCWACARWKCGYHGISGSRVGNTMPPPEFASQFHFLAPPISSTPGLVKRISWPAKLTVSSRDEASSLQAVIPSLVTEAIWSSIRAFSGEIKSTSGTSLRRPRCLETDGASWYINDFPWPVGKLTNVSSPFNTWNKALDWYLVKDSIELSLRASKAFSTASLKLSRERLALAMLI